MPQKKWNVYNYDNREVVSRDEQMVREERERRARAQRSKDLHQQVLVARGESEHEPAEEEPQKRQKRYFAAEEEKKEEEEDRYEEENELYAKARRKQKRQEGIVKDHIMSSVHAETGQDKHLNLFANEEMNERIKHSAAAPDSAKEHVSVSDPVFVFVHT